MVVDTVAVAAAKIWEEGTLLCVADNKDIGFFGPVLFISIETTYK